MSAVLRAWTVDERGTLYLLLRLSPLALLRPDLGGVAWVTMGKEVALPCRLLKAGEEVLEEATGGIHEYKDVLVVVLQREDATITANRITIVFEDRHSRKSFKYEFALTADNRDDSLSRADLHPVGNESRLVAEPFRGAGSTPTLFAIVRFLGGVVLVGTLIVKMTGKDVREGRRGNAADEL